MAKILAGCNKMSENLVGATGLVALPGDGLRCPQIRACVVCADNGETLNVILTDDTVIVVDRADFTKRYIRNAPRVP